MCCGTYRRLSADVTIPADYNTQVVFVYLQGTSSLPVDLIATVGWFGGSNGTLTMPDFSGVSGWNNAWVPSATATGTWILSELGRSTGLTAPLCVEKAPPRGTATGPGATDTRAGARGRRHHPRQADIPMGRHARRHR